MTLTPISVENEVRWEDFDVVAAWQAAGWPRPTREAFDAQVRLAVANPDEVEIVWCDDCEEPSDAPDSHVSVADRSVCDSCVENYYSCEDCGEMVHGDDTYQTQRGESVCGACLESSYTSCENCREMIHNDDTYWTLHEDSVCDSCLESSYAYCEDCDGYYHENYGEDHDHQDNCGCESPQQTFSMRNDGESPLSQDERITVPLPAGIISEEGIRSICRLIQDHGQEIYMAAYHVAVGAGRDPYTDPDVKAASVERGKWWTLAGELASQLDPQWQTKAGNYTKRLSKLAHKSQGLKVPPALLSQVGCIARDNSTGADYEIEVTRDLNLPAEDFYHEDSCWWQSYSESRCALKTNGGIGMRTFTGDRVSGRAWVMPLRLDESGELQPTFDSLTPDAFIVFNGYGNLSGYTPARIVAQMAGMTYRKIGFDCSPMYVNNGSGYLVAPEEIAAKYATKGQLSLDVATHSDLYDREQLVTV